MTESHEPTGAGEGQHHRVDAGSASFHIAVPAMTLEGITVVVNDVAVTRRTTIRLPVEVEGLEEKASQVLNWVSELIIRFADQFPNIPPSSLGGDN